jgi:hypothetical protein
MPEFATDDASLTLSPEPGKSIGPYLKFEIWPIAKYSCKYFPLVIARESCIANLDCLRKGWPAQAISIPIQPPLVAWLSQSFVKHFSMAMAFKEILHFPLSCNKPDSPFSLNKA